jgi:hypothetical protein
MNLDPLARTSSLISSKMPSWLEHDDETLYRSQVIEDLKVVTSQLKRMESQRTKRLKLLHLKINGSCISGPRLSEDKHLNNGIINTR